MEIPFYPALFRRLGVLTDEAVLTEWRWKASPRKRERHSYRHAGRQAGRRPEKPTDRQAGRQTDRQTNGQTTRFMGSYVDRQIRRY